MYSETRKIYTSCYSKTCCSSKLDLGNVQGQKYKFDRNCNWNTAQLGVVELQNLLHLLQ